jgi:beta-lactamase regulating signal transducer with metallopeptidase domain
MNELGMALVGVALRGAAFSAVAVVLYVALGRRGPAGGSFAALAGLVGLAIVPVLALAPWPARGLAIPAIAPTQQKIISSTIKPPKALSRPRVRAANPRKARATVAKPPAAPATTRSVGRAPTTGEAPGWRWPAWAALGMIAATGLGLARLAIGVATVRSCRARSFLVHDEGLIALVEALRAEVGCGARIELRESLRLTTAATIGWRRPIVLLPIGWRGWSDAERRVVLAHELAHVRRGDFGAALLAQASLALSFYQPLAHWLAGRLRLEQELAADDLGATLSGGRVAYLTTLAGLALRQDARPAAWPARSFLPTRGTFLRRIEMLRDGRSPRSHQLSRGARVATIGLFTTVGVVAAALRGPVAPTAAMAQVAADPGAAKPPGKAEAVDRPFDLSYVPADAAVVVAVRPAAVGGRPELSALADYLEKGPFARLGVAAEAIEQATFVMTRQGPNAFADNTDSLFPLNYGGLILRAAEGKGWDETVRRFQQKAIEAKHAGHAYFKSTAIEGLCFATPDARTLVIDSEPHIRRALSWNHGKKAPPPWADSFRRFGKGQGAIAVDVAWFRTVFAAVLIEAQASPFALPLAPLWEETDTLVLGVDAAGGLTIQGELAGRSEAGAEKVTRTLDAVLTLARNAKDGARRLLTLETFGAQPGKNREAFILQQVADLADDLLKSATVERDGTIARLHLASETDPADLLLGLLPVAEEEARQSANLDNLRRIGKALNNYREAHGRFPPAVVLGPDGKTPHSWRVEILPYLDIKSLYDEYKLDEPWDGEHNRKLVARMPDVFGGPAVGGEAGRTAYLMITNPDGPFRPTPSKEGPTLDALRGAKQPLGNAVVLEAQAKAVEWTRPADFAGGDGPIPAPPADGKASKPVGVVRAGGEVELIGADVVINDPATIPAKVRR